MVYPRNAHGVPVVVFMGSPEHHGVAVVSPWRLYGGSDAPWCLHSAFIVSTWRTHGGSDVPWCVDGAPIVPLQWAMLPMAPQLRLHGALMEQP